MATNPDNGFGVLFQNGNGAVPEIFTTLYGVTNIKPPSMSRDTIDTTHEQSPGGYREFIAGLVDPGEASLDLNYIPGGPSVATLLAEFDLPNPLNLKNRRILFPDGSYLGFAGILSGYEPDTPLDDKMALSVTFKVSGRPNMVQA